MLPYTPQVAGPARIRTAVRPTHSSTVPGAEMTSQVISFHLLRPHLSFRLCAFRGWG